jgi:hypothetical protein
VPRCAASTSERGIDRETPPAPFDALPADLVGVLPWAPRAKGAPPVVGKKNPARPRGEQ